MGVLTVASARAVQRREARAGEVARGPAGSVGGGVGPNLAPPLGDLLSGEEVPDDDNPFFFERLDVARGEHRWRGARRGRRLLATNDGLRGVRAKGAVPQPPSQA